jgi:hypothetical protein
MGLQVTERQTTRTWYELSGEVEARRVFPKLLASSRSIKEVDQEIRTEPEEDEGKYDGFRAEHDAMECEIEEFTQSAIAQFHDEALAAAKGVLMALKSGQTLLLKDFEEAEINILDEAGSTLGIAVPWDPTEAAQMAAKTAADEARLQQIREREELHAKQLPEVLENATRLLKTGHSHSAVKATFPAFTNEIAKLVGELRKDGVQIASH